MRLCYFLRVLLILIHRLRYLFSVKTKNTHTKYWTFIYFILFIYFFKYLYCSSLDAAAITNHHICIPAKPLIHSLNDLMAQTPARKWSRFSRNSSRCIPLMEVNIFGKYKGHILGRRTTLK